MAAQASSMPAAPEPRLAVKPTPKSPSIYHILLSLSIMTLGTIFFWSFTQSLSTQSTSTSLFKAGAADCARCLDSSATTFRSATGAHPFTGNSEEQHYDFISRFETQVRELDTLLCKLSAIVAEEHRNPLKDTSQTDEAVITAVTVLFIAIIKLIGLVFLDDALNRISERHSTRTIALGIIFTNIGALWSLPGLGSRIGFTGEGTWDGMMLSCLFGLDIGCLIGSIMAFGDIKY
ncbi:hypothetical protein BX600DRAFT_302528 [Xylariales sp. PMI_506]|nr:hypothetical protein BX600DRAFT_302528 [Xylariales sp. PMI_506]